MKIVFAVLLGLIWGAAAALVNSKISAAALKKNTGSAIQTASVSRMAVDIAALGLVFLLRKVLPFSFEVMLVATAIAMSLTTIYCAFRLSNQHKPKPKEPEQEAEKQE